MEGTSRRSLSALSKAASRSPCTSGRCCSAPLCAFAASLRLRSPTSASCRLHKLEATVRTDSSAGDVLVWTGTARSGATSMAIKSSMGSARRSEPTWPYMVRTWRCSSGGERRQSCRRHSLVAGNESRFCTSSQSCWALAPMPNLHCRSLAAMTFTSTFTMDLTMLLSLPKLWQYWQTGQVEAFCISPGSAWTMQCLCVMTTSWFVQSRTYLCPSCGVSLSTCWARGLGDTGHRGRHQAFF